MVWAWLEQIFMVSKGILGFFYLVVGKTSSPSVSYHFAEITAKYSHTFISRALVHLQDMWFRGRRSILQGTGNIKQTHLWSLTGKPTGGTLSIIRPCEETEERKVQSMSCSVCQTKTMLQEVEGLCNMKKIRYNSRGGVINMNVKITKK